MPALISQSVQAESPNVFFRAAPNQEAGNHAKHRYHDEGKCGEKLFPTPIVQHTVVINPE
jgi:hypothetical protein